jgi:hypothetical protein
MLFSLFPFLGSARLGTLQLPGLLPNTSSLETTLPNCSAAVAAALIGLALLLVWTALRRSS